jgi:hypothetical protein
MPTSTSIETGWRSDESNQIPLTQMGEIMTGTTFILRIEGSYGFWSMRVVGRMVEKVYIPFSQVICA